MRLRSFSGLFILSALLWIVSRIMKNQRKIVSTSASKTQRNNNPFALIQAKPSAWKGLAPDSGSFLKFIAPRYGVRAGYINLVNAYIKRNLNTIEKIFPVYAPISDGNKPDKYIEFVEQFTGIKRNEIIDDADQLYIIGRAIERVEAGKSWVDAIEWDQGWTESLSIVTPTLKALNFRSAVRKATANAGGIGL